MPRIRALTDWTGRKAGEEWDAADADARLLCAPDLPGGQRAEYVDRAMRADITPAPEITEPNEPQAKRRYLRRDMQAQN